MTENKSAMETLRDAIDMPHPEEGPGRTYEHAWLRTAVQAVLAEHDAKSTQPKLAYTDDDVGQIKLMLTQLCYAAWSRGWEVPKP